MEYTNSPLVSYTKLSILTSGQRKHAIDRITPHCYVGQVTVQQMGDWFYNNSRSASCNYGVAKDGQVGLFVEEKNRSYCSSNVENDNRAITIECASDTSSPYAFKDIVYQRLIELCIDICRRNGKSKLLWFEKKQDRLGYNPAADEMVLTMHRDLFDTDCPGQWMVNHMSDLAEKVTAALGGKAAVAEDINVPTKDEEPAADIAEPVDQTETHGTQAKNLAALTNVQIVDTVGPLCTEDQKKTGILASVTMAQFILESGYSRTELAKNANNCFGMKKNLSGNNWSGSAWDGTSVYRMATDEYNADGSKYTIVEDFRKYPCIEDSIADHSAYLLGAKKDDGLRYVGLKGCTDYRTAAQIIKDGGYATAPDYVDALCNIIEMWGLTKFEYRADKPKEPANEFQTYLAKVIAAKGSTVNLRNGASVNNKVLIAVPVGSTVTVTGLTDDGKWAHVSYSGTSVYDGYMMVEFLQQTVEEKPVTEPEKNAVDIKEFAAVIDLLTDALTRLKTLVAKS